MGFLGVYKAIYDYEPQSEGELAIVEGDTLYILEKDGEDSWWKAKKKACEIDEEEPVGLVPNNYVEQARPISSARALYDYTRQTDEEVSLIENALLDVYDTSDTDWILVGLNGEYGFAPANYIEIEDIEEDTQQNSSLHTASQSSTTEERASSSHILNSSAAAPPADIIQQRKTATPGPVAQDKSDAPEENVSKASTHVRLSGGRKFDHTRANSGNLSPSHLGESRVSTPPNRNSSQKNYDFSYVPGTPQGFHIYNVNEMVSVMGRKKKMPTTLGINHTTGVILIVPEKSRDGPEQRWTAEKMTHYSIEGKHVFLELIRPTRSIDFHAGAKDTAQEIVDAFGELAGAVKAEGLREVIMAGSSQSQKKAKVLYDFLAQEDNELTVSNGEEVSILDNTTSDEWWQVRRLQDGREGVVPSSYLQITGVISALNSPPINLGRTIVEQNRLEEQRLAKDSVREGKDPRNNEVCPGVRLPERGSSLSRHENSNQDTPKYNKDRNDTYPSNESRSKPDPSKVRTWNDRSKSFSVEAQFLALKDGKINLHKMNGVKIAVPVSKMSIEDLEYVERQTGISLDDDKPLSGLKKSRSQGIIGIREPTAGIGATIERPFDKKAYDWFQFFLGCEVSVNLCERYSQAFQRDSIDESVLPDIDATVLRTLGIREGDIIKIMRFLDKKFSRSVPKRGLGAAIEDIQSPDSDSHGGLFSGPGGTLKNNTRKGRPAPAIQTNNTISLDAFSQDKKDAQKLEPTAPLVKDDSSAGFEDDAWNIKPSKQNSQSTSTPILVSQSQSKPITSALTGAMGDLSLLSVPLEPKKLQPTVALETSQSSQQTSSSSSTQVAAPSLYVGVGSLQTGLPQQQTGPSTVQYSNQLNAGISTLQNQTALNHPFQSPNQAAFVINAPNRPLSAPIANPNNTFSLSPLQPQATGIQRITGGQESISPHIQNTSDPMLSQVLNGFNGSQALLNTSKATQPSYSQLNNQVHIGMQPSFQQISSPSGMLQQNLKSSEGNSFSNINPHHCPPIFTQPSGMQNFYLRQPQNNSVNSFLTPPLQPIPTGIQLQTNVNPNFNPHLQPQTPQYNAITPLIPQKTGPPPPVRFGISSDSKTLMPQAIARRANLSQATPQNPFGF